MSENTLNNGNANGADINGVPLGGVGAGCIEMGRDGRFRNITINNNRTSRDRIPVSPGSFLAVRTECRGKVSTRLLQASSDLPFQEAGIVPSLTPVEQMHWRGLYPCSIYKLNVPQFPLEVTWQAMTPIIPYDHEASTLPVVFFGIYLKNPTDNEQRVSALINWENLCGCTANHWPARRGPMRPIVVEEDVEYAMLSEDEESTHTIRQIAGIEFGFRDEIRTNAEGNYCLVAKQQEDVDVTILGWNERDPRELEAFWQQFYYEGRLKDQLSRNEDSHSGAVCNSFTLPPKSGRNVVFILSWYCPRYEIEGVDQGNGYCNIFSNAMGVTNQALRFYRYYFKAVENWHGRIMGSSLPRWLNRMLINNNSAFSTNTLFTRSGDFAMFETPEDPRAATLDRRFHSSLGTLLFFPDFETRAMTLIGTATHKDTPGRFHRYLGNLCTHNPNDGDDQDELVELSAKYILMAYRDYIMTGKRFILEHQFPKLQKALEYLLSLDKNRDGLPEQSGISTTYDNLPVNGVSSHTAGLWIVALRAYTRLAARLGHKEEAEQCETVLAQAIDSFDKRLWDPSLNYYRLAIDDNDDDNGHKDLDEGCHLGQLTGAWYADFLCLGHLFPHEKVEKALGVMCSQNECISGVANIVIPGSGPGSTPAEKDLSASIGWPSYDTTHYASLLITRGYADRGLYVIQKAYKNIQAKRSLTFNQPFQWDVQTNEAHGWGQDRHMGATSIWHILYAIQGFHLDVPDCVLWLKPNLPRGVRSLRAPLFTPLTFGWLKFAEDDNARYAQQVQIQFDSPVRIKTIVLRVPNEVEDVHVKCVSAEGRQKTEHFLANDGPDRLVEIALEEPISVSAGLSITLLQTKGKEFSFADHDQTDRPE